MKKILIGLSVFIVLAVLLALDLSSRGLFWRFAWSVTGEEEPLAQLRGVSEWLVSFTRPQPRTAAMTPIQHTNLNPYGINVFLQQEVEVAKIEAQLQMISDAGFGWIRQQFEWAEIEVDGRGRFTDSRNDVDGDGQIDTIDAWAKYDRIVDLTEQYGLQIQARLDNPPAWSHANPAVGSFAPPDDLQDFVNYAAAVAERYKGRIRFYQVWNEPNIYPEWGEQPVNPEGYTDLLCRTYAALKAVDPEIVVISASLAPTISLTGRDLNDFIFLERMYNAGAGNCFDVMSVQGYGLNSGPTDRRMRPTTINVARNLYIRDLMVAHGDAHKPIWISEAAWNFVPPPEVEPNIEGYRYMFGQVTPQQAADYMPQLYERAQKEWPWVGVMNYWFFTRAGDWERSQPMYYFRMVEPDYSPQKPTYTPLPIYDSMKNFITTQTPTLYTGVHQAEQHWAIQTDETAQVVRIDEAQFREAVEATEISFVAYGTDVRIRWQGDNLNVTIDDEVGAWRAKPRRGGWTYTTITHSLLPESHTITLSSETPMMIDSITISNRTYANLAPLLAVGFTGLFMLALSVWMGLRARQHKR